MEEEATLYFDPFAEGGDQLFDPAAAFGMLEQQYIEGTVTHNFTADEFVSKTVASARL